MDEGGCSRPVWLPDWRAARMTCQERLWISALASTLACSCGVLLGSLSICSGVRSALACEASKLLAGWCRPKGPKDAAGGSA